MALTPALLGPHFRWRGGQAQPALLSVPDELREVLASGTPALADVQAAWDAAGARYSPNDLLRAIALAGWSVADAVELFTDLLQTPGTVDDLVPAEPTSPRRKPRSP